MPVTLPWHLNKLALLVFDFQTHSQLLWAHRETHRSVMLFTLIHGIVLANGTLSPGTVSPVHGTFSSCMGHSVYGTLTSWDTQFMGPSVQSSLRDSTVFAIRHPGK